jgi:flagellar hook protein FlgE
MDVVGNNIANVNTSGYKASRVNFEDLISQTFRGASPPSAQQGGVSASQVGLGAQVAGVSMVTATGSLQATQSPTDVAIQGDGYFVLSNGQGGNIYTRDGAFTLDAKGLLVNGTGQQVLGWAAAPATGLINTNSALLPMTVPSGDPLVAQPSTQITFTGNLDERLSAAATIPTDKSMNATLSIYDSLGQVHHVDVTFTKTNDTSNSWSWAATTSETGVSVTGSGTATFDPATGAFNATGAPTPNGTITLTVANGAKSPQAVNLSFAGLTQVAASGSVNGTSDGQGPGSLSTVTIGTDGTVTGVYSNGQKRLLGQIALASFTNPQGLFRQGAHSFVATANSGSPVIGAAGTGSRGQISSGYLEMSNVDLTQEFSNMIMAQRGFQASTRVITVSDQMMQEIVNLKPQ